MFFLNVMSGEENIMGYLGIWCVFLMYWLNIIKRENIFYMLKQIYNRFFFFCFMMESVIWDKYLNIYYDVVFY